MLEDDYRRLLDRLLASIECHVTLPDGWDDFWDQHGVLGPVVNDARRFVRYHHRSKAVFEFDQTLPSVPREVDQAGREGFGRTLGHSALVRRLPGRVRSGDDYVRRC